MKNEAKTGLRVEQGRNMKKCNAMHYQCVGVANLWCQKKVMLIFCTMEFIIDQHFASKCESEYFFVGVLILKHQQNALQILL